MSELEGKEPDPPPSLCQDTDPGIDTGTLYRPRELQTIKRTREVAMRLA